MQLGRNISQGQTFPLINVKEFSRLFHFFSLSLSKERKKRKKPRKNPGLRPEHIAYHERGRAGPHLAGPKKRRRELRQPVGSGNLVAIGTSDAFRQQVGKNSVDSVDSDAFVSQ